ncbi:IS4 family transposase [Texcoconibacillus texcoconensis]|uniref:Transposase IS4-like domain-containing protein n=1 Tax=Texcoconibacillus texcoconensis TaxID=1095777 RepID=A0A840QMF3_9BACI|nr:IS4 family transposase [Texcoconibacillus texcoconensis]MBB5172536.1 hypothetical protein [Texcoconibacillus texcoconensis]
MSKLSLGHKNVTGQCFSLLPVEKYTCPILNYDYDKLSVDALFKIGVAAQLNKWQSYDEIVEGLSCEPEVLNELNLKSISASQLSRRINDLPTEWVQDVFFKTIELLERLTKGDKKESSRMGPFYIVDSTPLKLPLNRCDWAKMSSSMSAVKMHLCLAHISDNISYPVKMLPSTGNVSDFESVDYLIEKSDYTYLMDRGYPSTKNLEHWLKNDIKFVARITKSIKVFERTDFTPTHPSVQCDAEVYFGLSKIPVRLVEFYDDQQRFYRIMTNRWDLTDQEIMKAYRKRWEIENFFKWIKQHLRFTEVWSTKPQGIWNQMFFALIAQIITLIIKLTTNTKKTDWEVLRIIRIYWIRPWVDLLGELNKKKRKSSKGRRKIPNSTNNNEVIFSETVARIKPRKRKI